MAVQAIFTIYINQKSMTIIESEQVLHVMKHKKTTSKILLL